MDDLYKVYVIQSISSKELYFGMTKDIDERLAMHNKGSVNSTRDKKPWRVVYVEAYCLKQEALDREQTLKQYGNVRTYIKKRIQQSIR